MKTKTATLFTIKTIFATGIAFTAMVCTAFSFAEDNGREITHGTIRVSFAESEYPAMAKVSIGQAMKISLASVEGSIIKVKLENENGFLVYNAEVVTPDKEIKEVNIDAGSGQVLLVEDDFADNDQNKQDEEEDSHREIESK